MSVVTTRVGWAAERGELVGAITGLYSALRTCRAVLSTNGNGDFGRSALKTRYVPTTYRSDQRIKNKELSLYYNQYSEVILKLNHRLTPRRS